MTFGGESLYVECTLDTLAARGLKTTRRVLLFFVKMCFVSEHHNINQDRTRYSGGRYFNVTKTDETSSTSGV